MKLDDVASASYRSLLEKAHEAHSWGNTRKHVGEIRKFANRISATSILDYGCGRKGLASAMPGWDVREFDPGIREKSSIPRPADLVVCTDVLEHVEPDKMDAVLDHIRGLSLKGTFLIIAMTKARLSLADGRNAHLSLHRQDWWREKLIEHRFSIERTEFRKGWFVWIRVA